MLVAQPVFTSRYFQWFGAAAYTRTNEKSRAPETVSGLPDCEIHPCYSDFTRSSKRISTPNTPSMPPCSELIGADTVMQSAPVILDV